MLQGAYNLWGWRKTGIQNIRNDYTWNLGLTHTPIMMLSISYLDEIRVISEIVGPSVASRIFSRMLLATTAGNVVL